MKQVCPAVIFGIPLAFLEQSGDSILPASGVNQAKIVLRHFFFAKRVSRYVLSYYNKLFLFADSKLKHTIACIYVSWRQANRL